MAVLGIPLIGRMQMITADVGGLQEAHQCRESLAHILILVEHVERVSVALHLEIRRRACVVTGWEDRGRAVWIILLCRALYALAQHGPVIIEPPRKIRSADPIESAAKLFVRVHQADI